MTCLICRFPYPKNGEDGRSDSADSLPPRLGAGYYTVSGSFMTLNAFINSTTMHYIVSLFVTWDS